LKRSGIGRLIILVTLLLLSVPSNYSHWIPSLVPAQAQSPSTFVFVNPVGIQDLQHNLPRVTFAINVSGAPSINNFQLILSYNTTVLGAPKINTTGSVLGPDAQLQNLCVDNIVLKGRCFAGDGTGVISILLALLGSSTQAPTNGFLFHVTFNVIGTGLGQLHIFSAHLTTVTQAAASDVPLSTEDGYYTNLDCPKQSGTPCKPPIVAVKVTPPQPSRGSIAAFNATVTYQNANAATVSYKWDWGDGTTSTDQYSNFAQPTIHTFSINSLFGLGGCVADGVCPVTLLVFNNQGIFWETTILVHILYLNIALVVGEIKLDHQYNVVPGTLIHINAHIVNKSTIDENATLAITLEGANPPLNVTSFNLPASGGTGSLRAIWSTSGLLPRAYEIRVIISNPVSADGLIKGENDTSKNVASSYIILISPIVTGALSLSLVQTTGLGILVLVAAGFFLARFLKKPSYESEQL
jgi:hypothetical protein